MARKAPDQDAGEALRRFKSDLKAGTLGNFYIISGEEAFLRSHYVDLITKKIADGPAGEFNCHRFSADDCTPQALADAIDAMPMMAERTLVRVDDVDLFKQRRARASSTPPFSPTCPTTAACCSSTTRWSSRSTAR